jgi:hypothetical protein
MLIIGCDFDGRVAARMIAEAGQGCRALWVLLFKGRVDHP